MPGGMAFLSPSIIPVYDEDNDMAQPVKFATPMSIGYDEYFGNPVATAYYSNRQKKAFRFYLLSMLNCLFWIIG